MRAGRPPLCWCIDGVVTALAGLGSACDPQKVPKSHGRQGMNMWRPFDAQRLDTPLHGG